MLLDEYIYPNARFMHGSVFRKKYCYNMKVNEIYEKNANQIQKLYDSFTHMKKKYITVAETKEFVRKMELNISELMVGAMYAESMQTIVDNMSDPTKPDQMNYVEFLVFLCRITQEHYESTEHKDEKFYMKLDHILPKYLDSVAAKCDFQFEDLFATEVKEYMREFARELRKFKKEEGKALARGEVLDPKVVKEFKEYEKSLK